MRANVMTTRYSDVASASKRTWRWPWVWTKTRIWRTSTNRNHTATTEKIVSPIGPGTSSGSGAVEYMTIDRTSASKLRLSAREVLFRAADDVFGSRAATRFSA